MSRHLAILLLLFTSCTATVELEGAGRRQEPERRYPARRSLSLLVVPPPRRIWIPPAASDPYARLVALLQQGNPSITRVDVIQFVSLTQGIPLTLTPQAYINLATPAIINLVLKYNTPTILPWLLANRDQLINELIATRFALANPAQGHFVVLSNTTLPALLALWGNWKMLAERGPALLRPLLPGFEEPILFVFGGEEKYDVGLLLRKKDKVHTITREGYKTQKARGLVDLNTESLTMLKGSLTRGEIKVTDVIASKRYRSLERLSGGGDLEPIWDLETKAVLQYGVVRVGWSEYAEWAGLEWSDSDSWWDVHVALGWPYSSIDVTIRTPRQFPVGLGIRAHVAVLVGSFLQGDARLSPGVWAGPEFLRLFAGVTFAAVPTRIRGRIRGAHIRSHVGLSIEIKGFEVEGLIEPPGGRWRIGYRDDWWSVSALGDVVNGLGRYGGRIELGPFTATVLYGLGLEGSLRFALSF